MPLDIFFANILNLFTQLNLMDKFYINRRLIVFCKDLKSAKVQQFNLKNTSKLSFQSNELN